LRDRFVQKLRSHEIRRQRRQVHRHKMRTCRDFPLSLFFRDLREPLRKTAAADLRKPKCKKEKERGKYIVAVDVSGATDCSEPLKLHYSCRNTLDILYGCEMANVNGLRDGGGLLS
jgi:hypothetical protein